MRYVLVLSFVRQEEGENFWEDGMMIRSCFWGLGWVGLGGVLGVDVGIQAVESCVCRRLRCASTSMLLSEVGS